MWVFSFLTEAFSPPAGVFIQLLSQVSQKLILKRRNLASSSVSYDYFSNSSVGAHLCQNDAESVSKKKKDLLSTNKKGNFIIKYLQDFKVIIQ